MAQDLRNDRDSLHIMTMHLNAALAEASSVVQAVDHYLGEELGVGITAASRAFQSERSVGDDDREMLITSHLAYGRVAGENRLYVLRATIDKSEWQEAYTSIVTEERTPWASCPREVKLQSFAMLPELLDTLALRVGEVAAETAKTVGAIRERLDAMRRVPVPEDPAPVAATPALDDLEELPPGWEVTPPSPVAIASALSDLDLSVTSDPTLFKRPRPK